MQNLENRREPNSGVLVCQVGARRRYAVPRMFEDAGMLAALYTDSSSHSLLGKLVNFYGCNGPEKLQRLAGRTINGVPKSKIFSTDYPLMRALIAKISNKENRGAMQAVQYGNWLSEKLVNKGIAGANFIYSMNCSCLDFVSYAKKQGCKSVIDVFMHPLTLKIIRKESEEYPKWGQAPSEDDIKIMDDLWGRATRLADILLCPSEWVAEGIRKIGPTEASKIRVVPYGCTLDYGERINRPVKGRIFFAGGNALIKGLPYLAQATAHLLEILPDVEVRVAGQLPDDVMNNHLCKKMKFLGKITSAQMKEEYLSADVFALPSLSEGFAGVVAEAIGAGCPVVVTKESGSPIVHKREGLIVEARNADALAEALRTVISDRQLRSDMSGACLRQYPYYSTGAWQKRLIDAIMI